MQPRFLEGIVLAAPIAINAANGYASPYRKEFYSGGKEEVDESERKFNAKSAAITFALTTGVITAISYGVGYSIGKLIN